MNDINIRAKFHRTMGSTSKLITGFSLWLIALSAYAQTPLISSIDKTTAGIGEIVTIAGSGFDNSAANLAVEFGAIKAVIVTATENLLEVEVPSGATLGSISVTHKTSNKTGYSSELFKVSFGGEAFDVAKLDAPVSFTTTFEQFDICLCDFDGDDKVDIATTKSDNATSIATDISIYHNTGSNSVAFNELNKSTNSELEVGALTKNIYCADINSDGKPEIVVSRDGAIRNSIFVLRNISTPGNIQFDNPIQLFLPDGERAQRVNIRDLDGDGKPEITVTNTAVNNFFVFINSSTASALNLSTTPLLFLVEGSSKTGGLDVEDLNGDGLPEIITNPNQSTDVYIKTNTSSVGNIQFETAVKVTLALNINELFLADIDGDEKPDIVASLFFNDFLGVLLNTSSDVSISFGSVQTFAAKDRTWSLDFGDVDGDGLTDIISSAAGSTGGVELFINNSTPGSLSLTPSEISTVSSRFSKIGDVSGDGKPDLLYTSFDGNIFNLNIVRNGTCPDPVIFPPEPLTICTGETKRLEVPFAPFVTYVWTKDAVQIKSSADPFVDITAAGVYQVTAEGQGIDLACAVVQSVTVTADATSAPTLAALPDPPPVCIAETLSVTGPTVAAGIVYAWTGPNNFTSDQKDLSVADMTLDKAGRYFLKVIDGVCESNEISILVQVISPPSASISADGLIAFCQGGSVGLSVINDPSFSYQWFKDDVIINGETNTSLTATAAGSYTVELSLIAGTCTFITDPEIVSILAPPTANFNAATRACVGDVITFENTSTIASGETPNYLWNFGDGTATSNVENPTHEFTTANTYTVTYTVTYDDPNCIDSKTQDIVVSEPTAFTFAADPAASGICEGDTITISLSGTFASYLWSTSDTSPAIDVTQDGSYRVDATNAAGCVSIDSISVSFLPAPVISIFPDSTVSIIVGESVDLLASGADSYTWSPDSTLDNGLIPNPVATPSDTTTYTVVGVGANGCEGSASITINVAPGSNDIIAAKAFTPNNDAINDTWIIEGIENEIYTTGCRLIVFDRQGTSVLDTQTYINNDGWNGTSNGKELPQGAYYWIFKCNNEIVKTGSVTIIR